MTQDLLFHVHFDHFDTFFFRSFDLSLVNDGDLSRCESLVGNGMTELLTFCVNIFMYTVQLTPVTLL